MIKVEFIKSKHNSITDVYLRITNLPENDINVQVNVIENNNTISLYNETLGSKNKEYKIVYLYKFYKPTYSGITVKRIDGMTKKITSDSEDKDIIQIKVDGNVYKTVPKRLYDFI